MNCKKADGFVRLFCLEISGNERNEMIADANLQVWLDTQVAAGQTLVVPYVKSIKDMQIGYRMEVVQRSGSSNSRISQQGRVDAAAGQPASLGRVILNVQRGGECRIELALHEGRVELGIYRFDCPH
jgi:hypothetical protein